MDSTSGLRGFNHFESHFRAKMIQSHFFKLFWSWGCIWTPKNDQKWVPQEEKTLEMAPHKKILVNAWFEQENKWFSAVFKQGNMQISYFYPEIREKSENQRFGRILIYTELWYHLRKWHRVRKLVHNLAKWRELPLQHKKTIAKYKIKNSKYNMTYFWIKVLATRF